MKVCFLIICLVHVSCTQPVSRCNHNGLLEPSEEALSTSTESVCDDGNTENNDGCSSLCLMESAPTTGNCQCEEPQVIYLTHPVWYNRPPVWPSDHPPFALVQHPPNKPHEVCFQITRPYVQNAVWELTSSPSLSNRVPNNFPSLSTEYTEEDPVLGGNTVRDWAANMPTGDQDRKALNQGPCFERISANVPSETHWTKIRRDGCLLELTRCFDPVSPNDPFGCSHQYFGATESSGPYLLSTCEVYLRALRSKHSFYNLTLDTAPPAGVPRWTGAEWPTEGVPKENILRWDNKLTAIVKVELSVTVSSQVDFVVPLLSYYVDPDTGAFKGRVKLHFEGVPTIASLLVADGGSTICTADSTEQSVGSPGNSCDITPARLDNPDPPLPDITYTVELNTKNPYPGSEQYLSITSKASTITDSSTGLTTTITSHNRYETTLPLTVQLTYTAGPRTGETVIVHMSVSLESYNKLSSTNPVGLQIAEHLNLFSFTPTDLTDPPFPLIPLTNQPTDLSVLDTPDHLTTLVSATATFSTQDHMMLLIPDPDFGNNLVLTSLTITIEGSELQPPVVVKLEENGGPLLALVDGYEFPEWWQFTIVEHFGSVVLSNGRTPEFGCSFRLGLEAGKYQLTLNLVYRAIHITSQKLQAQQSDNESPLPVAAITKVNFWISNTEHSLDMVSVEHLLQNETEEALATATTPTDSPKFPHTKKAKESPSYGTKNAEHGLSSSHPDITEQQQNISISKGITIPIVVTVTCAALLFIILCTSLIIYCLCRRAKAPPGNSAGIPMTSSNISFAHSEVHTPQKTIELQL